MQDRWQRSLDNAQRRFTPSFHLFWSSRRPHQDRISFGNSKPRHSVNSPSGRTPAAPKMVKREISKLVAHRTQESSEAKF